MTSTKKDVNLRNVFRDLVFGWSSFEQGSTRAFLKHLSIFDQVDIEDVKNYYREKAKNRGLPTEEEALARLKEEDLWTSYDDGKIKEQEEYIKHALVSKKQLYLKREIENITKDIEEAQQKLSKLLASKDALLGQTCEKYAESRMSDHYVLRSLYADSHLTKQYYNEDQIDNLSRKEMSNIIKHYNSIYASFTDNIIQKVILQDFYQPYIPFCEDVTNMFSKPLFELSLNQVKLVIYSRMFKNIFENYPNIPEEIKTDPEKVVDYVNAQEKAKENLKNLDKDGATTIIGAKKEDYEYLGVEGYSSNTLSAKLKEKGGKMDMKDLMQALNVSK